MVADIEIGQVRPPAVRLILKRAPEVLNAIYLPQHALVHEHAQRFVLRRPACLLVYRQQDSCIFCNGDEFLCQGIFHVQWLLR